MNNKQYIETDDGYKSTYKLYVHNIKPAFRMPFYIQCHAACIYAV